MIEEEEERRAEWRERERNVIMIIIKSLITLATCQLGHTFRQRGKDALPRNKNREIDASTIELSFVA